ncbi:hypothetical protein YN1_4260 [Nanoarchaeota archaeon]
MDKYKYILFILSLLSFPIFSQTIYHTIYLYEPVAFLNISLYNNYLTPNQTLYYNVTINYRDIYYIPNVSLVIQIIKKNDNNNIYPFQFNNDNEIYEYVIKNLYLEPGEKIIIPLNYTIPYDLSSGYYYIVAYLYTPLGNINGLPFIYYPGVYTEFYVNNPSGNYPFMYIVKNNTYISSSPLYTWGSILSSSGYYYSSLSGPTGYGVTNYINLTVGIYSGENANATLKIRISPWDDILYSPLYTYEENITLNQGYNQITIPNIFVGDYPPNAYSLRIELISSNQIQSIYRLRFIVLGPTIRLDGVFLQGNGNLTFIVAPSPDHYTYPTTPNVIAQVYSNTLGFEENISLGNISWYTTEFTYVNLKLLINSSKFDLCINLYSNGYLYYGYCTYYYLNSSDTYGIPLSNLIYVNYTNNYFYICSNISGNLVVSYNSPSNSIFSTNINKNCYNYTFKEYGTYYISFYSSQYSNNWIISFSSPINITKPTTTIVIHKTYNNDIYYLIGIILIILVVIILIMKKKKIFAILLLLFFLPFIHSQSLIVSPNSVCYPTSNASIITENYTGLVNVTYSFYNPSNPSIIYSQGNYSYLNINGGNITYVYNLSLNNLPAGIDQSIEYNITVENCTTVNSSSSSSFTINGQPVNSSGTVCLPSLNGNSTCGVPVCNYTNYVGYINSSYPFYFEYYTNPIYIDSDDAAYIIAGCPASESVINNTYFNFTATLPNGTSIITSVNCPGSGDPDWGVNICDLYTSNYDSNSGNYTYVGSYYYNGQLINGPFIDNPLQVLTISAGTFTNQSCSHAETDTSASTTSNPLSINIGYYGPNSGTYYTYYNGIYVLAQNTTLGFSVSSGYNWLCSDGATSSTYPEVAVWLYSTNQNYNTNSEIYTEGLSNIYINFTQYDVDRNIIYNQYPNEGFVSPYGFGISSGYPVIYVNGSSYNPSGSIEVSSFGVNQAGYYLVYQDYIKTFCVDPASYICDPNGQLCNIGDIKGEAQGWLPINPEPGYYILVINPNASVNLQNLTYYPYIYNTNPGDAIYIGWIDNVGIGNLTVNENYILPDPTTESNNFLLPQGENMSLYIYFPTNECLHTNCQIPYNVDYQNAYGLTVYSPVSYSGYVNINWDSLNVYANPSITKVTYGEPINITIAVQNLGPVPAENVSIYNLQYDPACIEVLNIYNDTQINPGATGYVYIEANITNLNCNPQDYNLSFQVYGWNTYIYNYSLILPISYIISPPNGAQLQSPTTFNIYDVNAQQCKIVFNGASFDRNCDSQFIYQSSMCPGSLCNVQIQSYNNYAEYYEDYEYYNYLSNQTTIFGIISSTNVIGIYVGQYYTYSVLVKNLVPSTLSCQLLPIPTTENGKAQVIGYNVNGVQTIQFTVPPEGISKVNIEVLGIASGIDNLIYGISCNSTYGSASYSQEVPIYVFTSNNVISNYTVLNLIVSEKINPTRLIGIATGVAAILTILSLI